MGKKIPDKIIMIWEVRDNSEEIIQQLNKLLWEILKWWDNKVTKNERKNENSLKKYLLFIFVLYFVLNYQSTFGWICKIKNFSL